MMTRLISMATVGLLLAGLVTGCSSTKKGMLGANLNPEVVEKVRRGMTESQVEDLIGPPTMATGLEERRHMWTYRFVRVSDRDGNTNYRAVPLDMPDRYHGMIFIIFDGTKVVRVQGGEMPIR